MLDGEWIEHCSDWALILPILEMTRHPVHILDGLYLYEPNVESQHDRRKQLEANGARIVARPRCAVL
jgi:hypothetical protein